LDTEILGISRDDLKSHAKFRDNNDLNFHLLSDVTGEVHELFKVIVPKKMYGKEYMGTERSTFIFNENGELVKEFRKVKPEGHAEEVLSIIKEM
jgi:peroxiredoxin Q/BCP